MDQNQWFNSGSPAPTLDRQAFEAGWTAAQRQMAFTPQTPQINERIFQQQPQTPPPRPTYLRVNDTRTFTFRNRNSLLWIEAEEWVCNFIADYGRQIFQIASTVLGDEAWSFIPYELERLVV